MGSPENLPPHDLDAERALLGGLMAAADLQGTELPEGTLEGLRLPPEAFYDLRHRRIYEAMLALHARGKPPQAVLVWSQLRSSGVATDDPLGDVVKGLAMAGGSGAHVAHHAEIVRKAHEDRSLLYAMEPIYLGLQAGRLHAPDAGELLRPALDRSPSRKAPGARWRTAGELAADPGARVPFIVEGLVRPGAITLLAAEGGTGKSTFIAMTVRAALDGISVAGLHSRRVKSVLWVSEESEATLGDTLQPCGLQDPERRDRLHLMTREAMDDVPWVDLLRSAGAKAKDCGAEIVILDTFSALAGLSGDQENQAGHVEDAMRPVKTLAGQRVGVLLAHHANKNSEGNRTGLSRVRGSSALTGAVDAVFQMSREGEHDSKVRKVWQLKGRGAGWLTTLRYELQTLGEGGRRVFHLEPVAGRSEAAALARGEAILAYLAEHPGASQNEIVKGVGGNAATVRKALEAMAGPGGSVAKRREGKAQRYSLRASNPSAEGEQPNGTDAQDQDRVRCVRASLEDANGTHTERSGPEPTTDSATAVSAPDGRTSIDSRAAPRVDRRPGA